MHITALNIITDEKKYNKNVKKSLKKIGKLETENHRSTMEDDIFLPDPNLWDMNNKSDSFFKQAERIRNLRYKGIKTIYATDFTDDIPRIAKDPVFREKNGIGFEKIIWSKV